MRHQSASAPTWHDLVVIIYLFNLNFGLVGFGFRDDLGAGEGEAHRIHVGGASPSLTPGAGSWSGLGLGPRLNDDTLSCSVARVPLLARG
jgi:hypothetical protein